MDQLYKKDDKVMLKTTGEVFTVVEDLSYYKEPGILVQENAGLLLVHADVRPAGHTRQRRDAAIGITEPEPPAMPPADRLNFDSAEGSAQG